MTHVEAKLTYEILRETSSQYYNIGQILSECLRGFRATEARVEFSALWFSASSKATTVYHVPSFLSFREWRGIDLQRLFH